MATINAQPEPDMTGSPDEKRELPALGVHDDLPFMEYLHSPGISKHGLDLIQQCPELYLFRKQNPEPATPAMVFGSALHTLVLEPHKFDQEFTTVPSDAPKKPTAAQVQAAKPTAKAQESIDWWARFNAENADKIIISTKRDPDKGVYGASDYDRLHYMRDSIMANPFAAALLEDSINERSMYWVDPEYKRLCRHRVDFHSDAHNLLGDIKSADDASYDGFSRAVDRFRYDVQDAFYSDGTRFCDIPCEGFVFVVVEKKPPYLCACYMLTPEWREIGRIKYMRNLGDYDRCLKEGTWPGYPEARDLEMPRYARTVRIS